jgi:hypothetical protein
MYIVVSETTSQCMIFLKIFAWYLTESFCKAASMIGAIIFMCKYPPGINDLPSFWNNSCWEDFPNCFRLLIVQFGADRYPPVCGIQALKGYLKGFWFGRTIINCDKKSHWIRGKMNTFRRRCRNRIDQLDDGYNMFGGCGFHEECQKMEHQGWKRFRGVIKWEEKVLIIQIQGRGEQSI